MTEKEILKFIENPSQFSIEELNDISKELKKRSNVLFDVVLDTRPLTPDFASLSFMINMIDTLANTAQAEIERREKEPKTIECECKEKLAAYASKMRMMNELTIDDLIASHADLRAKNANFFENFFECMQKGFQSGRDFILCKFNDGRVNIDDLRGLTALEIADLLNGKRIEEILKDGNRRD